MENWCTTLCGVFNNQKQKEIPILVNKNNKLVVLKDPTGREIELRFKLGRELGRGKFGTTYLCEDRTTGEKLACKLISKDKLKTAIDIENVRREVEIMKYLPQHPNIVSLKCTYEDDDNVYLVMELCKGGSLLDRIVSRGEGYYSDRSAAFIIKTVIDVVQMCHKHGLMHRNINLENFLFADNTVTTPLKVSDFHLSIFFKPGERLNQIVGNLYYMAPEVLKRNYGPEIDIWSAGVILYILLYGSPPFWAETEEGVAQTITESIIDFRRERWPRIGPKNLWPPSGLSWSRVSRNEAIDLVKKMLDPDPKRRLTAQEVLDHPWLLKLVKKKSNNAQDLVVNRMSAQRLVMKMLDAHELLGHPWLLNAKTVPNVSFGEKVRVKLLQFSVMNQLTKTTSRVIADHLYDEEFSVRDTGIKGRVDHDEVRQMLYRLGQQNPNVQRLIDAFDGDKDGYLKYEEFLAVSDHLRKRSHKEHVDTAFQFFDQKRSGYIEFLELRNALVETADIDTNSKEIIEAIMNDFATNKVGRISYDKITDPCFKPKKKLDHFQLGLIEPVPIRANIK